MNHPALQLPPEVWNSIFGYLSAADKFSVRASCKYFKKLVDHGSLWKDWAVVLSFQRGFYNSQFWATLRRRKVTSVVLTGGHAKDWNRLAQSLPSLTTVVMDPSSPAGLDCLKGFPHLKHLAIRSSVSSLLFDASTVCKPEQLTQLSLCNVNFITGRMESFISAVSLFTNLTYLVCHHMRIYEETVALLHSILTCLPKLKHLSLSMLDTMLPLPNIYRPDLGPQGGAGAPILSSLELVNCTYQSSLEDAMRLMPGLKSLALFYKDSPQVLESGCQVKRWLSDLPHLSTLVIVKGPPVQMYVTSIPHTLSSLTLRVAGLSLEDMAAVAGQVPTLTHLHIDTWPSHLGAHTAHIPKLFPKLRSLKLRHEHVPERDFLQLHRLQDLEHLEILDSRPHLSELIGKLRALTKYRLQVTTSARSRDVLSCTCVCQMY